jgi:hypothetical protein
MCYGAVVLLRARAPRLELPRLELPRLELRLELCLELGD